MRCSDARKQLSAYIDDELKPREKHKVQYHLDICNKCREELIDLKATVAMLEKSVEISLPINFYQNVLVAWSAELKDVSNFSNAKIVALGTKRKNNWWNIGIGVAAIVATVFIGNSLLSDSFAVPQQKLGAMLAEDDSGSVGASASAEQSIINPALPAEKKAGNLDVNQDANAKIAIGDNYEQPAELQPAFGDQAPVSSAGSEEASILVKDTVRKNIDKFLVQARDGISKISNVEIVLDNSSQDNDKVVRVSLEHKAIIINEIENELTIMLKQTDAAQLVDTLVADKNYLINTFTYNVFDSGSEAIGNTENSITEGVNSETTITASVILKFKLKP